LKFFDGFPDDATVEKVYDDLDFHRGVEAYLTAIPGASMYGLREGFRTQGADNNQTVLIMENLLDSKSLFLTPNTETIYNLMWLDLKNGPLVIETPPNILGIIDDFWFHYVGDVGNAGPDKGKGGKFLLLPPGYTGEVPTGYLVFARRPTAMCSSGVVLWLTAAPRQPLRRPRNWQKCIRCRRRQILHR